MRIEYWSMVYYPEDPYMPIELKSRRLRGHVYGNQNYKDGTIVLTEEIARVDKDVIITINNQQYSLGRPDPNYEKQYPHAKERLLRLFAQHQTPPIQL